MFMKKNTKLHVGVIIVTWNSEKDIKACLESLQTQDYPDFDVVIVDNNSHDNTVELARNTYPSIDIIQQDTNHMLCKSNNDGIKYMWKKYNSHYVIALNPDTKLETNTISQLVALAETDTQIAAVGPKILFWNNENEGLINSAGLVFDGFIQAYDRGIFEEDRGQYDAVEEVDALTGACVLYRSSTLREAGLYFEPLKLYLDDLEMGIRLRKHGYKLVYNPAAIVHHAYMTSTSKLQNNFIPKQKMSAWLLIALRHYSLRSKLAMVRKYLQFKITGKTPQSN